MVRARVLAGVAVVVALLLSGCTGGGSQAGGDSSAAQVDPDGTFRYVYVQNPVSLDPHRSPTQWDMLWLRLAYDQLLWQNQDGELEPMLATEWEFVDEGKALEMTLRDDVTFIDGEKFNAAAVKANLERAKASELSVHKANLERVAAVEVVDDYRVRINLNGPGGNLPNLFASNVGSMISPAAFNNPDLDQNPVGSGMAKLAEMIPGQVSRWDRNESYWDADAAKAAHYEIYVQSASPTRMNMLTTGQAELTYLLPQDRDAAQSASLNTAPSLSSTIFSLRLHAKDGSLDDPRVRAAVEHAIDRQALVDGVFFGFGVPVAQHLPPGTWAYDDSVSPDGEDFKYDPALSKKLLAESGHANGFEWEMIIPGLDDHRAVGDAVIAMLGEVGIDVKARVVEPTNVAVTFSKNHEGELSPAAQPPITDPTNNYQRNLAGQYYNPFNNTSDEFTQAWMDSLIGDSNEERLPAIHRMIEAETKIRNVIPLLLFTPPSVWTENAVFPEGYEPAYCPHFRGVGVTAD